MIKSKDQFKDRYLNAKVEEELVEFKEEIQKKFQTSKLRDFKYPLKNQKVEKEKKFDYKTEEDIERLMQEPSVQEEDEDSIHITQQYTKCLDEDYGSSGQKESVP